MSNSNVGVFEPIRFRFPEIKSKGIFSLRISLAIVFFWFGGIKLWPASPANAVVKNTIFFLPHPQFFWILGAWEVLVGLMLLSRRTIRAATWLLMFQMVGTQTTLIFFPEGAWLAWGVPSDLGVYVLKNWILVSGVLVVALYYTGSDMREPPVERLRSSFVIDAWWFVHRMVTSWFPRNALTFMRASTSVMLILFGALTVIGHGEAMTQVADGLAALGIHVSDPMVFRVMGVMKLLTGITLLSDELVSISLLVFSVYLVLGMLPMFVIPEQAFYKGYTWIAPAFFTLYFLKDLVVFGAIYTIYDVSRVTENNSYWNPAGIFDVGRDLVEATRFWVN